MSMMQMIVWKERCIKVQICCNMHGFSSSGGKPTLAPFLDLCICAGHRSRDAVICMDSANLVAFFVSFFHQSLTSSLFSLPTSHCHCYVLLYLHQDKGRIVKSEKSSREDSLCASVGEVYLIHQFQLEAKTTTHHLCHHNLKVTHSIKLVITTVVSLQPPKSSWSHNQLQKLLTFFFEAFKQTVLSETYPGIEKC